MLRIFICEDDTIQRKKLERIIQRYILIEELDMQLQLSTADPFEILTYLNEHPQTAGVFSWMWICALRLTVSNWVPRFAIFVSMGKSFLLPRIMKCYR